MDMPSTFLDFLTLIGSPVFIGIIVSTLLVKWKWFVGLASKAKFWIVGGICVLLPLLSKIAILYIPTDIVAFIESWYPTITIGMGVWATATGWNKLFGINGAVSKATNPTDVEPKG